MGEFEKIRKGCRCVRVSVRVCVCMPVCVGVCVCVYILDQMDQCLEVGFGRRYALFQFSHFGNLNKSF